MIAKIEVTPEKQKETEQAVKPAAEPSHFAENLPLDAPSLASATMDNAGENSPTKGKTGARSFTTPGEKVHKWGTYLSVDWIFNAASGVAFSYAGKYTEIGKKYYSGPLTSGFEIALKPFIKNPNSLKKSVDWSVTFVSIITGGLFTIPPLMALEKNHTKRKISEFFDRKISGNEVVDNDPRYKEAYDAIENAPKKDFWSGMGSRYVALSPLLLSVMVPVTRDALGKHYFSHINSSTTHLCTKAGITAERMFPKLTKAEATERFNFLHDNFAMDFGFGVPYAIMHAKFYNKFANSKNAPAETKAPPSEIAATPPQQEESTKKWAENVPEKTPLKLETKRIIPKPSKGYGDARLNEKSDAAERQMI